MADKERTPLLRGGGGPSNNRRKRHNENTHTSKAHHHAHIRSRSAGPTRQRSLGEVFTLDDDNRILHKKSQHGSEHGELQRNYSRFVVYGGDGGHSRKSSSGGVSNSSMGSGGGGGTGSKRSHRRQWSSATEPHRNVSSPTSSNRRPNKKPLPTQHENNNLIKDDKETQDAMKKLQEPTYERAQGPRTVDELDNKKCDSNRIVIQLERDYYAMVKYMIMLLSYLVLVVYTLLVLFGPLILLPIDKTKWCPESESVGVDDDDDAVYDEPHYENPDYITDPCFHRRLPELLGLTLEECDLSRRMLASVLFGGAIGYERRVADRPAGIRTMGLVSLGSCFFTISSQLAFKSSTMGWDASRVTAAIPSGVGFLGAGLIWKGTVGAGEDEVHQVHGLTTAASLWLSAAVGAGAGGALYMVAGYSVLLIILILRYGPQLYLQDDASYKDNGDEEEDDEDEWEESDDELKKDKKQTRQESVRLDMSSKSFGRADDTSLEGNESCPSFVSLTDLQHVQGYGENDSLRTTSPPPSAYGSTQQMATATEGDSERHSILRTQGTAGSPTGRSSGGKNVQIHFGEISPPPLSLSLRATSEARSAASRSSSAQKRLSSKGGKSQKKKKKRPISKRPTFHS